MYFFDYEQTGSRVGRTTNTLLNPYDLNAFYELILFWVHLSTNPYLVTSCMPVYMLLYKEKSAKPRSYLIVFFSCG